MFNFDEFDASQIPPSQGFDPLPAGEYTAMVTASGFKPTKDGRGKYLELAFQIVEGPFSRRLVWTRLNVHHHIPEVVRYARAELASICHAVGVMAPRSSAELHGIPLIISIRQRREEGGRVANVIRAYRKRQSRPAELSMPNSGTAPRAH